MILNKLKVLAGTVAIALPAYAQHEHHQPATPDTASHNMHHMEMSGMKDSSAQQMHMTHSFSLSLPMTRNGSGTGWQPDATPMYAYMKHGSKWNYMLHGSIYLRYTSQNFNNEGKKGALSKWSVPNWVMGMAQRQVGKNGLLNLRAMVSLDRVFDGGQGYPLLFQSGESWKGLPLIDRQHPHDLFSELSVAYTQRINDKIDFTLYAGYPGEPALGPTAFMHRMSAFNNPDAVIGHHWQDATHITFGVVTAGIRYGKFKFEGSSFTGREPNENRFDFDKPKFDSNSYRLLFNPSANWALQVSRGFIKSPEALHPDENINRTTASVQHSVSLGGENKWISSSAVWGMNDAGAGHKENAVLLETNVQLNKWAVYARYEWLQKNVHELFLGRPGGVAEGQVFPVNAISVGLNRQIFSFSNTLLQAGGQIGYAGIDAMLQQFYGKNPLSGQIYLRLLPGLMRM